MHSNYQEQTTE
jgi:hypothetical protein